MTKSFFYISSVIALLYSFNTHATEIKSSSTITADKLETNIEDNSILAKGNVQLINEGKKFYADELRYYKTKGEIEAVGRIKLNDEENNSFFSEKVNITDDVNTGEFYNGGLIFNNGSFIVAPKITRENKNFFKLKRPHYGICPSKLSFDQSYEEIVQQTWHKRQFLSIDASTVNVDKEKKGVYFYNAVGKMYGVPIFYLPYLKTKHPAYQDATGLKMPKLRHSSNYGYGLLLPYYIRLSDSSNMEVAPLFYEAGNTVLSLNYNKDFVEKEGTLSLGGDITYDNGASDDFVDGTETTTRKEKGENREYRGYGEISGELKLNSKWNTYFDGSFVSDNKYLQDYKGDYSEYLESNINLERLEENNILTFDTIQYRELVGEGSTTVEDTPNIIPILNHKYKKGFIGNDTNATVLYREDGLQYRRLSMTPSLEVPYKLNGNLFTLTTDLRADAYSFSGERINDYDSSETRVTPQAKLDWELPVMNSYSNSTWIISPMANVITSPNGDSDKERIPNEDSQASELNDINLFSMNRYSGYDRVEYGTRANYGLKSNYFHNKIGDFGAFLGQGYRHNDTENTDIRGFTENVSDWVGMVSYSINKRFDLYYRFRSDRTNWDEKNTEITSDLYLDRFEINTSYTMYKPEQVGDVEYKAATIGTTIYLTRELKLISSITRDLLENQNVAKSYELKYDGDCIEYSLSVVETSPVDEENTDRTIDFNLNIKASIF